MCIRCGVDEYYMSSVRQVDTLLTAATQSILLQITWSEAFKVRSANINTASYTAVVLCLVHGALYTLVYPQVNGVNTGGNNVLTCVCLSLCAVKATFQIMQIQIFWKGLQIWQACCGEHVPSDCLDTTV